MSTYQGIRGLKVRDYTTNPDNPLEGQLWYNKTDEVPKYQIPNTTASWRTISSLNTGRYSAMGTGTIDNGLFVAGYAPGGNSTLNEYYNGSSWAELADVNTARYEVRGGGTYTSSIMIGGRVPPEVANVESWNGSSWTEIVDLNVAARKGAAAAADNTNALYFGGETPPSSTRTGNTEAYNGSS